MVIFDATLPGTPVETWDRDGRVAALKRIDLAGVSELLVVGAHPDDETLGCGGLIAECRSRGIRVRVVIVTDGAASHDSPDIARIREAEARAALPGVELLFLGYPDGRTLENAEQIRADLGALIDDLADSALIAAPWRGDGHRDHRVVGEAVAQAIGRHRLLEYPVWLWHWGTPDDVDWSTAVGLDIDAVAKSAAIDHYASQLGDVLRNDFVEHFRRPIEVFFTSDALPADYFDALYARRADPWRLATRWYEERKRAATMAALPRARFRSTLEVGCSIGMLTTLLGDRSDRVLAVDISASAAESTRSRVGPNVDVRVADATATFPAGRFDLIVLSEVGYYFGRDALDRVIDGALASLDTEGFLVACHWRHPVADYPLSGDEVHAAIASRVGLERVVQHVERDFLLDVYAADGRSVAEREGLA